ncbi:protein SLOW GREEN 1, chloroplastic [Vitis riparia]|uniref:protein SLOW GREEN 1, chloroplastic n=1 Tax=Vitis riparia TaxID=96939 RepID=UPI00155A8219|nr:protein SLOW GREEN 1, chloroplastic [Vitis riparia]
MGSSSITTFSLHYQPKSHLFRSSKPVSFNPLDLHRSLSLPYHSTKLHISPKPSYISTPFSQFHVPRIPTSNFSRIANHLIPKEEIFKFFSEKVVVFLVGSVIFMWCLGARPAMALPAHMGRYSSNVEQKRDAQDSESEHDDMYAKVLEKDPRNVEALKVVLYGKMRRGKTKEAVEYVERLIDIEPDEVEWRLLQALSYEIMGHLSKAKRLFKEILKERPLLLRALHGLALVMHKNHEGPDAVFEMLNNALEVARHQKRVTEERSIRILIAQMHVVQGDLEEGLKKFQDLVDENPRDFRPYLCQGIIYSLLDKKKEAQEQFEIYRTLVPEEFPQRGFLNDVVSAAKAKSRERFHKEFQAEFSNIR